MTQVSKSWSFSLPKALDDDGDTVTITADLGFAANFVVLNSPGSLEISDIREGSSNIREGMFLMTIILDDGKDQVRIPFTLFVIAPPPEEVVQEPPEELIAEEAELEAESEEAAAEEELTEEEQKDAFLRQELAQSGYDFGDDAS